MMGRAAVLIMSMMCAALLGCAMPNHVTYATVNAPPRAFVRRGPASVDVFVSKPPTRPHVDVGLFEVYAGLNDDGVARSTEDMLGTLRLHAGLRGCDAVQVMDVEVAGRDYRRIVRGVCEMYTDEEAQHAAGHIAPAQALPGEGQSCTPLVQAGPTSSPAASCVEPLVCWNKVCASPYH